MWKTLIVLGLIGYAGWWGYQHYLKPVGSEGFQEFERFTDLIVANKVGEAENMTDPIQGRPLVAPTAKALQDAMPISHGTKWTEVVETPSANGKSIDFTAQESIAFDPGGTTSTFGSMKLNIKWEGTIRKEDDYWRVVVFAYTILGTEKAN